jgi:hypothetical protein
MHTYIYPQKFQVMYVNIPAPWFASGYGEVYPLSGTALRGTRPPKMAIESTKFYRD